MTLPHILSVIKDTSFQRYQTFTQSEDMEKQRELFSKVQNNNVQSRVTTILGDNYTQQLIKKEDMNQLFADPSFKQTDYGGYEKQKLQTKYSLTYSRESTTKIAKGNVVRGEALSEQLPVDLAGMSPLKGFLTSVTKFANTVQTNTARAALLSDPTFKYKVIDLVTYWLNIIRSSCSNNVKNPIHGPPIIRLSHGIMYQDIPCICTDHSISYDQQHGFDVDTLLPRVISIEMKLEELRTGDFGAGSDNYYITKDNLKGWESVISDPQQSMDPGYNYVLDELNISKPPRPYKPFSSTDTTPDSSMYTLPFDSSEVIPIELIENKWDY